MFMRQKEKTTSPPHTPPNTHILDGFELWGTHQRAGGSVMASVAELPALPCNKLR